MVICLIVGCRSHSGRDKSSFCRLPTIRTREGEAERHRSEERRKLWLKAIDRGDLTESIIDDGRVCWKHFVSGKYHDHINNHLFFIRVSFRVNSWLVG